MKGASAAVVTAVLALGREITATSAERHAVTKRVLVYFR